MVTEITEIQFSWGQSSSSLFLQQ